MDMKKFVDRKEELNAIKKKLADRGFDLIILFGRRRVGKTALILESVKNKEYIYFLAAERNNTSKFKRECLKHVEEIKYVEEDWEAIFSFLKNRIVIIDEFPNLLIEDRGILSEFQRIVDTMLSTTNTKLVLLGSSVSMMKSEILAHKSPLYGRITSMLELKPLRFFQIKDFFRNAGVEELIRIYGFADGIPYYLRKIDKLPFFSWLENEIKKPDTFLKHEIDIILRTEFDEPFTYKEILEAIALGKTKLNEIKNHVGIKGEITKYLKHLIKTDFVERRVPVTESMKSKKGRYYLKDNFLRFWFRFIYPNLSPIEEGNFRIDFIKSQYNKYLGEVFEKVCYQYLLELIGKLKIPYFNKIGKQWGHVPERKHTYEIDIVALNERTKEILFAECKWRSRVNAEKICGELVEKAEHVEWHRGRRKEILAVFAKSFSKRIDEFEGRKVFCFDLRDLERQL